MHFIILLATILANDSRAGSIHEMLDELSNALVLLSFKVSVEAEVAISVLVAIVQSSRRRSESLTVKLNIIQGIPN